MSIASSPRASAGATAVVRRLAVGLAFGLIGWAVGTASMWLTFWFASVKTGFAVRAILAPATFYLVSMVYFRRRDALRPPLAAFLFWCVEIGADAAVGLAFGSRMYDIPRSLLGTWLPAALVFLVTWVTGIGLEQPTAHDDATTEERTR